MIDHPYLFKLGEDNQSLNTALFRVRDYIAKKGGRILYESDTSICFYEDSSADFVVWMEKNNKGHQGYIQIAIDSDNPLVEEATVSQISRVVKGRN